MKKLRYGVIIGFSFSIVAVIAAGCGKKEEAAEDETVIEITREDADALVDEKLSGTDCKSSFNERIDAGESSYYVYNVEKDGEDISDSLAVDVVSGEVYKYDSAAGSYSEYSEFSEYSAANDENITWNGTYKGAVRVMVVEEQDPGSFMYDIYDSAQDVAGGEAKTGFAYMSDNVNASSEFEGENLSFELKGDVLKVVSDKADSVYAGSYQLEK